MFSLDIAFMAAVVGSLVYIQLQLHQISKNLKPKNTERSEQVDEKERARMIADAISGLTYREWQAVSSAIEAPFWKRANKTLDTLTLTNTDIEHLASSVDIALNPKPLKRIKP